MIVDVSQLKAEASTFPEPLKSLILLADQKLSGEELVVKFIEWRRIARILDGEGKKNGQ